MRRQNPQWIAAIRRSRRAIAAALLPAFAWWSVSASACFGLPLAPADAQQAMVVTATMHADQGSAAVAHDHASMPDCPHCPTPAEDDESTPLLCATEGSSNANGPQASAAADILKLFAHSRPAALPWSVAPPPPIHTVAPGATLRFESTPLNVRHCVFLI